MRHALLLVILSLAGCALTSHAHEAADIGASGRSADLLRVVDQPGPIEVETIASADWAVPLGGLVDLSDPTAKAAHLADHPEPIQVFFHVVRHPRFGTFIVDTGFERAMRDDPAHAAIRGPVARFMHSEWLRVHTPLADWIEKQPEPLRGVFLTHLHLDHVSGLPDVPRGTPIYAGPGEAGERTVVNGLVRGCIDRALAGHGAVREWRFSGDVDGRFAGIVDVLGDGSLWAIHVPGHTAGSTAYLARTAKGPVLMTGDTSHTAWGWEHDVAPGSYTADHAANRRSLEQLRRLVAEHPTISVRLGHQSLPSHDLAER